jgi:hypothetical protein
MQRDMAGLMKNFTSRVQNQSEEKAEIWSLVQPKRSSLEKLKRISIRNRAWFRVLDWKQRRFMDLVIKMVDKIRSPLLLKVLSPLVRRLLKAIGRDTRTGALALMDGGAYDMMRGVAEKIVVVAQKWGNSSAKEWLNEGLIKYLVVMNLPRNKNSIAISY